MQKPEKNINLFDLKTSQTIIGQEAFLNAYQTILDHGGYCQGKETAELETALSNYSNASYCATCASGTDALVLTLLSWGVKSGDAVFVPSWTFAATAEAAVLVGATPVFVDSDKNSWNMSVADLQKAIDEVKAEGKLNLKAVISVDIFGNPCDYNEISAIAKNNNMKYLSDACQSYGASYNGKKVGDDSLADATAVSFFPTKPLGGYGDGGAVFTNSEENNTTLKSCRVHGMSFDNKYDNIRIGLTGRMNSFMAASLLQKLTIFDKELVTRQNAADYYKDNLCSYFATQKVAEGSLSANAIFTITCDNRDELQKYLSENGVPCNTYYPISVHNQTAYKKYANRILPVADNLSKTVLSIPMHPYLTNEELEYIVYTLNNFAKSQNKAA